MVLLGACVGAASDDNGTADDENGGNRGNGDDDPEPAVNNDDESIDDENGGDENGDDDTDDTDDAEGAEDIDEPDRQSFSGSGDSVEDGVDIEGGLTVVDASHSGDGHFAVHLLGDGGEFDETLFVNQAGQYGGETADMVENGEYQLEVSGDGDWEVEIRQPRAASGDGLPQSLSGDSPEVLGPFEFEGSHTANGSHSGDSNFIVQAMPLEGSYGDLLFNDMGEYDGDTTFNHDGVGYVAIEANGDWSLDLE